MDVFQTVLDSLSACPSRGLRAAAFVVCFPVFVCSVLCFNLTGAQIRAWNALTGSASGTARSRAGSIASSRRSGRSRASNNSRRSRRSNRSRGSRRSVRSRRSSRSSVRGRRRATSNNGRIFSGAPSASGLSRRGGHEPRRGVIARAGQLIRRKVGKIPTGYADLVWNPVREERFAKGTAFSVKEKIDEVYHAEPIPFPSSASGRRPRALRYIFTLKRNYRPNNVYGVAKFLVTSKASATAPEWILHIGGHDQSLTYSLKDLRETQDFVINIPEEIGKNWSTGNRLTACAYFKIVGQTREAVDTSEAFSLETNLVYSQDFKAS